MLQRLQKGDLPDGCAGHAVVFLLQSDLLQGDDLTSHFVLCLVHDSVSTFAQLFELLVLVNVRCWLREVSFSSL